MSKNLAGISAIIVALALSAFGVRKENKPFTSWVWHKYNAAGTGEVMPIVTFTGDAAGARAAFGCPTVGSKICAKAYDDQGNDEGILITKP